MNPVSQPHQYIVRDTGHVVTEHFIGDTMVRALYARVRENATWLFNAVTSPRMSRILATINYDLPFGTFPAASTFSRKLGVDLFECHAPERLTSPRKIFERQIRYWHHRPMPKGRDVVVAPSDSRMLVASLSETHLVEIKGKFFDMPELLGQRPWCKRFNEGDIAIFRLTPEKYHHNHTPVAGRVEEIFTVDGCCHACHPDAVVREATPFSKNRRLVTLINTDVHGGTGVGLVAMVEVVALMIGSIKQCYSDHRYEKPVPLMAGQHIKKGAPKSLFSPGSSTVVLLFEKGRIAFDSDLQENTRRLDATSRFSSGFSRPLVETEVRVREGIATALATPSPKETRCP